MPQQAIVSADRAVGASEWIKGQPTPGGIDVQKQYSPIGEQAKPFHTALVWIMAIICMIINRLLH